MAQRKRRRGDLTAQPHDAIIKFTFSQREHAAGLLNAALDPAISAIIRWGTLKLETIHFVDRTLRGRYTDLLFSATMGDERIYMHVLLEHQRKVDPLMIFRMGSIMWRRWEQLVRDAPDRTTLPLIIPILIHHSATGWTAATAFEDLVVVPEETRAAVRRYIPSFEMKLVDVSRDPVGGLVQQALTDLGRVVLWCLSVAGDRRRFEAELDQLVAELNEIYATPREVDALVALDTVACGDAPGARRAEDRAVAGEDSSEGAEGDQRGRAGGADARGARAGARGRRGAHPDEAARGALRPGARRGEDAHPVRESADARALVAPGADGADARRGAR